MKPVAGLHKAAAGFAARRKAAMGGPCHICPEPSIGCIETLKGTFGICEGHAAQAEQYGYTVIRATPPSPLTPEEEHGNA